MKKVRIPFSLTEYQKGGYEVETRGDKDTEPYKVRILCTDLLENGSGRVIVAAVKDFENKETVFEYYKVGRYHGDKRKGDTLYDLVLVKDEFEDGDIVTFGVLPIIGIFKSLNNDTHCDYITYDGGLNYMEDGWTNLNMRLSTTEEKEKLFRAFKNKKVQWNPKNKCLDPVEKSLYNFTKNDIVLVRQIDADKWMCAVYIDYRPDAFKTFPYITSFGIYHQCIPYNDNTKHLLNTSEKYN